jgi:long-chain acyl-CoA synthetase
MDKVARYGDRKIALRQKDFGIWQEFTWQDSYEQVRDLCLGLVSLGLKSGDKVTTIGDNDRQYLWANIAVVSAGGVVVGMFTDSIPSEMEYIINHSEATFALAKDQEQCDKHLAIRDEIPNIKKVIYWDPRGMWSYNDDWLISFEEVQELGRQLYAEQPARFEEMITEGNGEDLCNLCYTSGTTGLPKGAMLSHSNFIASAISYNENEPRYDTARRTWSMGSSSTSQKSRRPCSKISVKSPRISSSTRRVCGKT